MSNAKLCRGNNELELMSGGTQFMTCIFDHPDGFYYDPVGNEIFQVKRISTNALGPVYKIDFGDEVKVGNLKDHGMHLHLK